MSQYKRKFLDRYDGRLIRTIDPFFRLIPYIMNTRLDSQNHFEEEIDLTIIDDFLKQLKLQGYKNISFLHVLMAGFVRTMSQKPALNRFVVGNKIYARNSITLSLAVKKQMTEESPETTIKIAFEPTDTIFDVADKLNRLIAESKDLEASNETDQTAEILSKCPGVLLNIIVWLLKRMDKHGVLPKAVHKASPFHTSAFVTDMGSLGIKSIYHHLYEFGTTSMFISFGKKQRRKILDENNLVLEKKVISVKIVSDERIVDGLYYARAFNLFNNLMKHPEKLLTQPEKIFHDIE